MYPPFQRPLSNVQPIVSGHSVVPQPFPGQTISVHPVQPGAVYVQSGFPMQPGCTMQPVQPVFIQSGFVAPGQVQPGYGQQIPSQILSVPSPSLGAVIGLPTQGQVSSPPPAVLPPTTVETAAPENCLGKKLGNATPEVEVYSSKDEAYSQIFVFRVQRNSEFQLKNVVGAGNADFGTYTLRDGEWSINTKDGIHVQRVGVEESPDKVYVAFHKKFGNGTADVKTVADAFTLRTLDSAPAPQAPEPTPIPAPDPGAIPLIPVPSIKSIPDFEKKPTPAEKPIPNPIPAPVPDPAVAALEAKFKVFEERLLELQKSIVRSNKAMLAGAGFSPVPDQPSTFTITGAKFDEKGGKLFLRCTDTGSFEIGWRSEPSGAGPLAWHSLSQNWRTIKFNTVFKDEESFAEIIERQQISDRHIAVIDIFAKGASAARQK